MGHARMPESLVMQFLPSEVCHSPHHLFQSRGDEAEGLVARSTGTRILTMRLCLFLGGSDGSDQTGALWKLRELGHVWIKIEEHIFFWGL